MNPILPFSFAMIKPRAYQHRFENGDTVKIQPVSIAYTRLDDMPTGRALRPYFAWYGDMELASHIWELAGLGLITVEVVFHPQIY